MSKPEVTLSLALSPASSPLVGELKPEERGIHLIQLLLTCATHASSGNLHRADTCLLQITQTASVTGDPIQRLAAWFASALALRIVKRWPGVHKALNYTPQHDQPAAALPVFSQAFPCLTFAYAIITRTLLRSMSEEHVIHLVDLGSGDSKLWVPIIRSFALQAHGTIYVKITCVHSNKTVLQKLASRLVKEAEVLDMPFQFNPVSTKLTEITTEMLKPIPGESLAFVSILKLHTLLAQDDTVEAHFGANKRNNTGVKPSKQMEKFLATIRSMSPKILLLVEQEADHNLNRLSDRFVEGLHYYSAVFDSIDANFRALARERQVLEEKFGREIENIVASEGMEREERHERYGRWVLRFGQAGFKPVHLWCNPMEDNKHLVECCGPNGYKIVSEKGSLMICWHERALYAVSGWIC